jgi:cytohesin
LVIEGYTPLELAAWNMHFEAVKLLLDSAAEFTVLRDPIRRTTPLHFAAGNDDIRTLQLLLAYDFNVDSPDQRGQTPLHWAAARGHSECVIMLLEAGANMSLLSNEGLTPLVTALRQNHAYTVKILEDWTQTGQIRIQSEPERAIYDSQETLEYYPQELSIELREILKYEPQEVNINPHTRQPWPNNQFLHPNMHTHRQASASQIQ